MTPQIIRLADDFWNIRGSFKLGGVLDIGTQVSLVRRRNGKFVFLDAYTFDDATAKQIDRLTGGPENVEAVLNLHPFHTLHVRAMAERYPTARWYGTRRHHSKFPQLAWQAPLCEDAALQDLFVDDFEFFVPRGVDFVSANDEVHFASVLALHRASQALHVDDTLVYLQLPALLQRLGLGDRLRFHPTLWHALQQRPGAANEFRDWALQLSKRCAHAQHLCAAHSAILSPAKHGGGSIAKRILQALDDVAGLLRAHQRKYG